MPFCRLTESEVLDQLKYTFANNEYLPQRPDLKYFYDQLPFMDRNNIQEIRDKTVRFGKVDFTVHVFGHRENQNPSSPTLREELHSFSVYACNDPLFAAANADRYFYCPSIGEESFDSDSAAALGLEAAEKLFAENLHMNGYSYEYATIENWEYIGRGTEQYTEFTFRYNHMGQNADNIKGVGYGKTLTICNEPYPGQTVVEPVAVEVQEAKPPKKRAKWPVVLGTIVVLAIVAAAVAVALIFI